MLRKRQIHLDFHTSEYIENIGDKFNGKEFAKQISDASIDSITCFARCHHGWLYYDSKNFPELIHPHLKNKNLLEEQISECHKLDIKVPVYTTIQWDGRIMKEHPEWLAKGEDGLPIDTQNISKPHFYHTICLNTGYKEFFIEHLEDIIQSIGKENIDGFFMDILFLVDCQCDNCKKDMKKLNIDISSKKERLKFSAKLLEDFRVSVSEFLNERIPGVGIFYNSSHISPKTKKMVDCYSHLELESLPSGGWGYDHFPVTAKYARNLGKEIVGMTGKFHTYWGDFHSLKNKEALEFECFNMLLLGAGCSIGDQLHPNGALSNASYNLIGGVYSTVKKVEKYLFPSEAVVEIGVLTPEENNEYEDNGFKLSPSLVGVNRMLTELGYQFDIIDSKMDLSKYKLLILPDETVYNNETNNRLKNYVNNGGKILGSYNSNMPTNGEESIFGVTLKGESKFSRNFILPNDLIGKNLYKEEYVMYLKGVEVEVNNADIILETIEPYFERGGEKFCSHQHTPSSGKIGIPAATRTKNTVYFSHPIFKIYRTNAPKWCKEIFNDALELLLEKKLITHNGPSTLNVSLREQKQEKRYLLQLLNYIIEKKSETIYIIEEKYIVNNMIIKLNLENNNIKSIRNILTGEELSFNKNENEIEINVPILDGYEALELNY